MADTTWIASTLGKTLKATLDGTEVVRIIHDPSGTPVSRRTRTSDVRDYLVAQANTFTASQTISGGSLTLSGNISAPAWTTGGIRFRGVAATLTDTTSSGTVASACTNAYGGNTIAASSATTFTDYFTTFLTQPTAGANVTFTNRWALGLTGNLRVAGLVGIPQGTITANAPQLDGSTTWNNSGVTFTAWRLAVTNTASASASLLMDLLVGGSSVFSVRRDGTVTSPAKAFFSGTAIGEDGAGIVTMRDAGAVAWTATSTALSGADTFLLRDAANVVAQRNGATAQAFRVYGTWTNASNYERGALNAGADFIELAAETAGTGDDDLDVRLTPAGTGRVRFGAHSALAAETVTGFITIKDSGGTTRKLAVVS